ncbi:ribonuclease P protein component [Candidatus Gottesmanbacteria bacterium]|nr:ribonuclease P protein component [Candidatus Gottesmanbacteria bacterium]
MFKKNGIGKRKKRSQKTKSQRKDQAHNLTIKDNFFYYQIRQTSEPKTKIVISVPKKLSKLSTKRNRTKRVIREAIREIYPQIKKNTLLLIISRKILDREKPKDLVSTIKSTLSKLGLI